MTDGQSYCRMKQRHMYLRHIMVEMIIIRKVEADCQVAVTKKEDQSGGTTGGTTEETPGGTTGEKPEETPGGTTGEKPEETPGGTTGEKPEETPGGTTGEKPEETPGEPNQVETLSGKIILLRPKVIKHTSNVENINTTLKKAVIKADQQAKNSSIRIKCNARKEKKTDALSLRDQP